LETVADDVTPPDDTPAVTDAQRLSDADEPTLPALQLVWQDAEQLRTIARAVGIRLLAVDHDGAALGELSTSATWTLTPWNGRAPGYSNRVRVVPAGFFGDRLQRLATSGTPIREVWLLVPAELDRRIVATQLNAIANRGYSTDDIQRVRGRLVLAAGATARLVVDAVYAR
jgi:hypothetical protein